MALMIARHPLLSVIPVNEEIPEKTYFARLETVDLEKSVRFCRRKTRWDADASIDKELDETLTYEHSTSWVGKEHDLVPVWRVTVLLDTDVRSTEEETMAIIYTYHHAIGDGGSGRIFHRDLATVLTTASPSETSVIPASKTAMLPPPIEVVNPSTLSYWNFFKIFATSLLPNWYTKAGIWVGNKMTHVPMNNKTASIFISASATTRFRDECRTKKATVHTGLQTLIATAMFEELPSEFTRLTCSTPISMRKWLNSNGEWSAKFTNRIDDDGRLNWEEDVIGVYVTSYTEEYTRTACLAASDDNKDHCVNDSSVSIPWPEALRTRKNISNIINVKGANTDVCLLDWIHPKTYRARFQKRIGGPMAGSFEVSNVGVVGMPKKKLVAFEDVGASSGENIEGERKREVDGGVRENIENAPAAPEPLVPATENSAAVAPSVGRMLFSQFASVTGAVLSYSVVTGGDGVLGISVSWPEGMVEREVVDRIFERVRSTIEGSNAN